MHAALRHAALLGFRDFILFWNLKTWLGAWFVRAIAISSTWALLGLLLDSHALIQYLVIGNALAIGASAVAWTIPALAWDRMDGTYATLLISPAAMELVLIGRTLIWLANGIVTAAATMVALCLVFGVSLGQATFIAVALAIVTTMASTFGLCIAVGAMFSRVTSARNVLLSLVNLVLLTFTGASVPVEFWGPALQSALKFLPLTHGLGGLRASMITGTIPYGPYAAELAVGGVWLALGIAGIRAVAQRAMRDGDIE